MYLELGCNRCNISFEYPLLFFLLGLLYVSQASRFPLILWNLYIITQTRFIIFCLAARKLKAALKFIIGNCTGKTPLHMHFIMLFYFSNYLIRCLVYFYFWTNSSLCYISPNITLNYLLKKSGAKTHLT